MPLKTKRWNDPVEPDDGCPAKDRLGPYPTREQAAHALDKVAERNQQWDAASED